MVWGVAAAAVVVGNHDHQHVGGVALVDQIVGVDRGILDLALGKNAVADVLAHSFQNVEEDDWGGVHDALVFQYFP